MGRTHQIAILAATAFGATACAGQADAGVALQAAGILGAMERTTWTPPERLQGAYETVVLCVELTGLEGAAAEDGDPDPALLDALEAGGYDAVPGSDCSIPDGWSPSSDRPYTVTADGRTGLVIWVEPPNVEAGRVTVGLNPWPLMDYFVECAASREGSGWSVSSCETVPDA